MATTEMARIEERIAPEGAALMSQAHHFLIVDQVSYETVADHRRLCKLYEAKVEEHLGPSRESAHKTWKGLVAKIAELVAPAKRAAVIDGEKLAAWDQEQARIRREAEEAQARERERLEAEERVRVAAETARLRREEEDRRLEAALAAEARGDTATAQRIVTAPVEVEPVAPRPVFAPPVQVPEYQRPAGTSYSKRWVAELSNLGELIGAVAGGQIAPAVAVQLLTLNQAGATAYAKATRGTIQVPGLVFREVTDTRQTR